MNKRTSFKYNYTEEQSKPLDERLSLSRVLKETIDSDVMSTTFDNHKKHYDKFILFSNIRELSKRYNIKLGDIEKEAGVALGYMSRLNKQVSTAEPSLEFVCTAAEMLKTDIDSLLKGNLLSLSASEEYIMNFLKKLIKETEDEKLIWNVEKADYLNELCNSETIKHPLFTLESVENKYDARVYKAKRPMFKSSTFGKDTLLCGDCYNLEIPNGCHLYLMKVRTDHPRSKEEIEIWMYDSKSYKKNLLTSTTDQKLVSTILKLSETIRICILHPAIDKEFKTAIDEFMEN